MNVWDHFEESKEYSCEEPYYHFQIYIYHHIAKLQQLLDILEILLTTKGRNVLELKIKNHMWLLGFDSICMFQ